MTSKNLKFTKNLGYGAESSYLDIVHSICKICLSLTIGDNRKAVERSTDMYGQVE